MKGKSVLKCLLCTREETTTKETEIFSSMSKHIYKMNAHQNINMKTVENGYKAENN